jgi:hypothetical protein
MSTDLRRRIGERIAFLKAQLYGNVWMGYALRGAYEHELAELLPLLRLDPDERGILMERFRLWDIAHQCDEVLKAKKDKLLHG